MNFAVMDFSIYGVTDINSGGPLHPSEHTYILHMDILDWCG
jgi:hypothetical protein